MYRRLGRWSDMFLLFLVSKIKLGQWRWWHCCSNYTIEEYVLLFFSFIINCSAKRFIHDEWLVLKCQWTDSIVVTLWLHEIGTTRYIFLNIRITTAVKIINFEFLVEILRIYDNVLLMKYVNKFVFLIVLLTSSCALHFNSFAINIIL